MSSTKPAGSFIRCFGSLLEPFLYINSSYLIPKIYHISRHSLSGWCCCLRVPGRFCFHSCSTSKVGRPLFFLTLEHIECNCPILGDWQNGLIVEFNSKARSVGFAVRKTVNSGSVGKNILVVHHHLSCKYTCNPIRLRSQVDLKPEA
jgi:hypothetical protein